MKPRGVYLSAMRTDNRKKESFFMINVRIEMQLEEVFHWRVAMRIFRKIEEMSPHISLRSACLRFAFGNRKENLWYAVCSCDKPIAHVA